MSNIASTNAAPTHHPLPNGPITYHFHPLSPPPAAPGQCTCLHCKTHTTSMQDVSALWAHLEACPAAPPSKAAQDMQLFPDWVLHRSGAKALLAIRIPFDTYEKRDSAVRAYVEAVAPPGHKPPTRRQVLEWLGDVVDELEAEGHTVDHAYVARELRRAGSDVPEGLRSRFLGA